MGIIIIIIYFYYFIIKIKILEDPEFKERLKGRSNVNCKDKYRNLIKAHKIIQYDNSEDEEEVEGQEI